MIVMKVYRNARNTINDLGRIINAIWNCSGKIILKDGVGVVIESAESIANSFLLIQNAYADNLNVKIHTLELIFNKEQYRQDQVVEIVRATLYYFGAVYQNFVVVVENENEYHATFGINACSYTGAGKFVDNNAAYIQLKEVIRVFAGDEITFIYDKTVLFEDQLNKVNNYISVANT